jgi:uncharacterized membrane protein (UPF0127 family)
MKIKATLLFCIVSLLFGCIKTTLEVKLPVTDEITFVSLTVETTAPLWSEKFYQGLADRTSLDGGMLFDFEETVTFGFQMRETLIPLSIVFISTDLIIVDIQEMEPLSEVVYDPAEPYRYAVEVNQGYFKNNNIQVGDRIEFKDSNATGEITIKFFKRGK